MNPYKIKIIPNVIYRYLAKSYENQKYVVNPYVIDTYLAKSYENQKYVVSNYKQLHPFFLRINLKFVPLANILFKSIVSFSVLNDAVKLNLYKNNKDFLTILEKTVYSTVKNIHDQSSIDNKFSIFFSKDMENDKAAITENIMNNLLKRLSENSLAIDSLNIDSTKVLQETLETEETLNLHASKNTENFSYVDDTTFLNYRKIKENSIQVLQEIFRTYLKNSNNTTITDDTIFIETNKNFMSSFNVSEHINYNFNKIDSETLEFQEKVFKTISKKFAPDIALISDTIQVVLSILYEEYIINSIGVKDKKSLDLDKADIELNTNVTEIMFTEFIKNIYSNTVINEDIIRKVVHTNLKNTTDVYENISILLSRTLSELFSIEDFISLNITKNNKDTVSTVFSFEYFEFDKRISDILSTNDLPQKMLERYESDILNIMVNHRTHNNKQIINTIANIDSGELFLENYAIDYFSEDYSGSKTFF